jgi:hypothetical protein
MNLPPTDKIPKPKDVEIGKGRVITLQDINEWANSLLDFRSEYNLEYHTCPQVLENNVLIWKVRDQWYFADSDRNKWGFSAHPRIIHICKFCGEVLN